MDKRKNLIERFLEDYKMEGVCDFVVTSDDETGSPSVFIIVDSEWINSVPTNPDFVVRRMRSKLMDDINNWMGVEVSYVGSYVKKCDKTTDLLENVSPLIRRRLNMSTLPSVVDVVVNQFFPAPCKFSNYEFIENVASTISDIIVQNVGKKITTGEQNSLTVYLINEFADYLRDYYKTKCSGSLQSNESLMENVSPEVRRRIDSENLKDLIDYIVEYELNVCEYPVGEFVAEACDLAVNNIVDYVVNYTGLQKVTFKDRDSLYYFFVDTFGDYLSNYHRKTCKKIKESKKQFVVTETQYKRLFEQKSSDITEHDVRLALQKAFPLKNGIGWHRQDKEFTPGLRGIHTIGERIDNPKETWSIMNYFDTRKRLGMLNNRWKSENDGTDKIDWLIELFRSDSDFLKELLDSQFESIRVGYDNEQKAVKNLLNFIDSRGVDYEYEVYPYGHQKDRWGATDITIRNHTDTKVSDIQIKPLERIVDSGNGQWVVSTYGMSDKYKDKKNLGYILYNHENKFIIFNNKNYEVSDNGRKVIHYEKPVFKYTNPNTLTEQDNQKINLYSEDKNHIKKLEMFQNLIDKSLDYISRFCDYSLSTEDYAGDISFDSCDSLASIDGIKIDKLVFGRVGGSNSSNELTNSLTFVHLYLTINYHTIGTITDFDDILYDIKTFLRNKTGLHVIFTYTTHNLNTNKQW